MHERYFTIPKNGVPLYDFKKEYQYFRVNYKTSNYCEYLPDEILDMINRRELLFEHIGTNRQRRLYMDIDGKETAEHPALTITYDQIIRLADGFVKFMHHVYNYTKPIDYRVQVSILPKLVNNLPTTFSSVHIVFNVIVENIAPTIQIMNDFLALKLKHSEYIDTKVYNANRVFRAVLHRKPDKQEKLYPIGLLSQVDTKNGKLCTKQVLTVLPIDHKDFISNVQYEEFFAVELKETVRTTHLKPVKISIYNPVYIIDESRKLNLKLSKYTTRDYENSTIWKGIMRAVCSVLTMKGVDIGQISTESVFVNFLKYSMVGAYNTKEAEESNRNLILKKYAEKNSINGMNGFFHILHDAELRFIYNILGQLPEQSIQFAVKQYAKKYYIHIGTTALYCISSKSIMIDYNIAKTYNASDTAKKSPIYKFSAKQQFNYFIEDIKRLGNNMVMTDTPIFPTININNYNEITTDSNQSFYVSGPVGSRKSSLRLNLDVRDILNQNKDSKILMVADTKTMTEKIYSDMRYLVTEEGYNENIVGHYQKGRITEKIRIFIVCYDSVMKFIDYEPSHIILDEYKNIKKRFTKVSNNDKFATNETKQNQINNFYGLMNRAKSVKIYDADCDDYLLQNLKDKTNKKFTVFKLQNYIQYNDNISLKSELAAIKEMAIFLSDGKKITISCAGKKLAHSLSDKFTQLNKRICVITSTGAFDNLDPDATNPTELKKQLVSDTKLWISSLQGFHMMSNIRFISIMRL